MGADSNAFTSDDLTVYHILAGKAALPKIVEIEADRFQHLQYEEAEVPEGSARRAGRVQQERVEPDREDGRGAVRQRVHDPHVQAHDDGLPEGHREHAQGAGLLAAVLRSLLPARQRRSLLVVGDADPEAVFAAGREGATATGSAAQQAARRCPVEPPQKKEKRAALELEGRDAAACCSRAITRPRSRRRTSTCRRWTCWPSCCSPSARRSTSGWSSRSRRSRRWQGSADPHVDPNLFTVLARIKKPADIGYVEKAIHDEMARIAREGVDEKTLARGAVAREVRVRGAAVDGRQDRRHGGVVPGADRRPGVDQRVLRALRQGHQRRRQARRRGNTSRPRTGRS